MVIFFRTDSGEVCKGENVDEAKLCSGLTKKAVVKSRRIFCQIAEKKWVIVVRMLRGFLVSTHRLLIGLPFQVNCLK